MGIPVIWAKNQRTLEKINFTTALKKGMIKNRLCGKIHLVDIGIPPEIYKEVLQEQR
ncbi:MAG: hypothetical protein WCG27_03535 [Pseudomonadota bacterium]